MADEEIFESYARLELFGHRVLVGYVQDVVMFGGRMCRIDIMGPDGETKATQFYGASAVYCCTPITKDEALKMVKPWTPVGYQLGTGDADDEAEDGDTEPGDEVPV